MATTGSISGSAPFFREGDKVVANYLGRDVYCPGVIARDRRDGTYDIDYDDGDKESEVQKDMIRTKRILVSKEKKSELAGHVRDCYESCVALGSKLVKERIKVCEGRVSSRTIHYPFFIAMPADMQQTIYEYLDFTDFSSLIVSCKAFSTIPNKDEVRWKKIRDMCVENKANFVERFSTMHSWYKHLGSGHEFTFVLKPGRLTRGYGQDDVRSDDYRGRFSLHWNSVRADVHPISRSIELNCFYGRNTFIALSRAKHDSKWWQTLLCRHQKALVSWAASEKPKAKSEDQVIAEAEYNRQAEELYETLASLEDEIFGMKVKDFM